MIDFLLLELAFKETSVVISNAVNSDRRNPHKPELTWVFLSCKSPENPRVRAADG